MRMLVAYAGAVAFTTADLPAAFRATADAALLRAIRDTGLRLDPACVEHDRRDCPGCIAEAAAVIVGVPIPA